MDNVSIKKILVPIDFSKTSEIAMDEAIAMAKKLKAEISLIHVVDFSGYYFSVVPEAQIILPTLLDLQKNISKKLEKIKATIKKKKGITVQVNVSNGEVHSEIIDFSKKKKMDLIIMGTHGTSGFKEVFIGSNAQRVVTLSEIPVLTLQKKIEKSKINNILIPIDNSIHSREKINTAMFIAGAYKSKIHIVGLPDTRDKEERSKFKIKLESLEKIAKKQKVAYTTKIVRGESLAKAAMNYATKNKCDLIVINTGHESKVSGLFLGAFAQQIVNHSKKPVLSIRHTQSELSIETPGFGIY